jgi:hypothetical protein
MEPRSRAFFHFEPTAWLNKASAGRIAISCTRSAIVTDAKRETDDGDDGQDNTLYRIRLVPAATALGVLDDMQVW